MPVYSLTIEPIPITKQTSHVEHERDSCYTAIVCPS